MENVVSFVNMQLFNGPLLVRVLEAMRTLGDKSMSEEAWQALNRIVIKNDDDGTGPPLSSARGWYECA